MSKDFDFFIGSWSVHNRFLRGRLCGSTEWIEFDASSVVQHILGGLGNFDQYKTDKVEGVTMRLFDPATGKWSIYWADNVRPGTLLPPMIGGFNGDTGEFYGDEEVDGRKVLCRFRWTRSDSPRWEQAFSGDGGKTWETNWIMTFTRQGQ